MMIKQTWSFIKRDFLIEKHYTIHFFARIAVIFFQLAVFFFLSKLVTPDYFLFLFPGLLFSRIFFFCVSSLTDTIHHERYWGTLETLFLVPVKPLKLCMLLFFSKLGGFVIEFLIYVLFGWLVFGFPLTPVRFLLLLGMIVVNIFAFCGLGLINASFILVFKRGDS